MSMTMTLIMLSMSFFFFFSCHLGLLRHSSGRFSVFNICYVFRFSSASGVFSFVLSSSKVSYSVSEPCVIEERSIELSVVYPASSSSSPGVGNRFRTNARREFVLGLMLVTSTTIRCPSGISTLVRAMI